MQVLSFSEKSLLALLIHCKTHIIQTGQLSGHVWLLHIHTELFLSINFTVSSQWMLFVFHSGTSAALCQRKLKSNVKKEFQCVFEGISRAGNPTLLNQHLAFFPKCILLSSPLWDRRRQASLDSPRTSMSLGCPWPCQRATSCPPLDHFWLVLTTTDWDNPTRPAVLGMLWHTCYRTKISPAEPTSPQTTFVPYLTAAWWPTTSSTVKFYIDRNTAVSWPHWCLQ